MRCAENAASSLAPVVCFVGPANDNIAAAAGYYVCPDPRRPAAERHALLHPRRADAYRLTAHGVHARVLHATEKTRAEPEANYDRIGHYKGRLFTTP